MLHNLCSVADHVLPFVPDEQTIKATTQFLTASKKEWDEEWKAWFVSLDPLKASASQAGLEQSAGDGHVGEQESASGQRSIQGLPPGRSACRSKRRSRHRDGRSGGASAELTRHELGTIGKNCRWSASGDRAGQAQQMWDDLG